MLEKYIKIGGCFFEVLCTVGTHESTAFSYPRSLLHLSVFYGLTQVPEVCVICLICKAPKSAHITPLLYDLR